MLKPKVPVERIAFHEVTKSAIREAVENPREIDEGLVRAQESRRILDRLFGYMLSPVLWKKVRRGLSAGRVQSVAVRLCVIRERERRAFVMASYWDAEATFEKEGQPFTARLVSIDDQRLAEGKDFVQTTGQLKEGSKALWVPDEAAANDLVGRMQRPFEVSAVEQKPFTRRPAPPFTTSSLQQEANRKLRYSAQRTMRIAQRLYEGIDLGDDRVGLITYMRTDSLTLADSALEQAESVIKESYGDDYTDGPRRYRTKSANAQEAHEAIRPTDLTRTPDAMRAYLDDDELKLYELIWKRTIASQMTEARMLRTAIEIGSDLKGGGRAKFSATGTTIQFHGFLRAYVESSDDAKAERGDKETLLPALESGEKIDPTAVTSRGHETSPPARYTEASLVKKMEAEGIGRPSTYASITETIQNRGYVAKVNNAFVPTFTAFAVTQLLEEHFSEYIDIAFTRKMEEELDEIASGRADYRDQLRRIYYGNGNGRPGLERMSTTDETQIDYPEVMIGEHPETAQRVVVKVGRYGPYVQLGQGDERVMASIPADTAPADFRLDEAIELIRKKAAGPTCLGDDPETGLKVYVINGRFGPYFQLGETPTEKDAEKPKRSSLPKGIAEEEATLEMALRLLALPREVGQHPENGEPILATRGRFGPHLRCGTETRSLENEDQIFTITVEEALKKLAEPKRGRRQRVRTVLKNLGQDPNTETDVEVLDGPYGAYMTNGELNASVPDGVSVEKLELAEALQILADKGKPPRRKAAKTAKKKTTKKKSTKKKTTKKKSTQKEEHEEKGRRRLAHPFCSAVSLQRGCWSLPLITCML